MVDVYSENRVREIVREETTDMREELHRLGLRFEVMQDDIKVLLEVVSDLWGVKTEVGKHVKRLESLEDGQALLQRTIIEHDRRLQAIG